MPVLSLDKGSQALFTPGAAASVTMINLSETDIAYVATTPTVHATDIPVGPLASMIFDGAQWWYGSAVTAPLVQVAVLPGATGYGPGSLAISGPVTAEITGPVTVEGTVDIGGTVDASVTGTVEISGTPTVDLASGTTVEISGTPTMTLTGTADVSVTNATIDVIGSGGYVLPGQLALLENNSSSITAAAGSLGGIGPFDVSSYSSILFTASLPSVSSTATGAAICARWLFEWSDASGNIIAASDTISTLMGASVTVQVPVKGSKLIVFLYNAGSVGTITYSAHDVFLWGDYRDIPDIKVVNYGIGSLPSVTGWTLVQPSDPAVSTREWIANLNQSPPPSTSYLLPLSLWAGPVSGWYQQVTQALTHDATIVDLTYATQGNIAAGTSYAYGILANLPSAIQSSPVPVAYNSPPVQLALAFELGSNAGTTFLMLTGED